MGWRQANPLTPLNLISDQALKAKRYQEAGQAPKKIKAIDEATVTLVHYSTITDGFFLIERLDRAALVLTVRAAREGQIVGTEYRCAMGAPFDFAAERRF